MRSGTYPVRMKRGGTMPMYIEYNARYEHEPTGDGWDIEVESVRFSSKDKKDRVYLMAPKAIEMLQETLAYSVSVEARECGWTPPRPFAMPYYR